MLTEPKVNILLVDDRAENLLALEAILSDLEQNLVQARSGREALRCLAQDEFAVILLDVDMPGMDGFQTAARIREGERAEPTPIIFLTAIHESDAYMFKGYSLGALDYIFKPIKPEILKAKVRVFIDLFKKRQEGKRQAEEIKKLNEDLERRVQERTGELAAANTQLKDEITERERVEEALRASSQRLLNILESITDGFVTLDREGRFTYLNRQAAELLQREREELLGRVWWEEFPEAVDLIFFEQYQKAVSEQVTVEFEGFYPPLDTWVEIRAYPSPDGLSVYLRDTTHRKRAEEALRAQREWLRVTLSSVGDSVIATDRNGRVTFMNTVSESLTGWKQAEAQGKALEEVFHIINEETRKAVESPAAKVLREGAVTGLANHTLLIAKDGTEIPIDDSGAPILDDQGNILGVVLVFHDVTERRRAERALSESEAKFRTVAETAASAMFIYQGTKFRYVNPATERITGYTREELLAMDFWDIIHPDFRDLVRERGLARQRGEPVPSQYESKILTKTGEERWVEFTAGVIDFEGKPAGVGTAYDITERKQAEEERARRLVQERAARAAAEAAARRSSFLAEASQALAASLAYETTLARVARLAVSHVADYCLIYVVEENGHIRRLAAAHADPEKETRLGELLGRYLLDPNAPYGVANVMRTGRPEFYPEVPDALWERMARDAEHLRILRAAGIQSSMIVPLVARGPVLGAIVFVTAESGRRYDPADLDLALDLARRAAVAVDNARLYDEAQKAREEAEAASRAKDQFLATLSHELRTPLTPILGWARLLRSETLDETTAARALETVERNARTQAQLIEDLLDVSRIITGKLRLDVRPVELVSVIEAALDSVRPAAEAKNIRIHMTLDPSVGPVSGDSTRLQQVFWNLLVNAVKFTGRGGRVEVRLARTDSEAEIQVKDTGIGIRPELLPHVFERFRQADSSATRAYGGLGIGLALVRHLVELHGGRVEAHSPGEGQGTIFTVRLPLRAVGREAGEPARGSRTAAAEAQPAPVPQLTGLRVLVVDDKADTREFLAVVLAQYGAEVRTAASVAEAMAVLERSKWDVLIGDIGMPGEDGYDLIRKVKALESERGEAIPAVALTAYARGEDRLRVLSSGYRMHVPKPVEPTELIMAVASVAGRAGKSEDVTK